MYMLLKTAVPVLVAKSASPAFVEPRNKRKLFVGGTTARLFEVKLLTVRFEKIVDRTNLALGSKVWPVTVCNASMKVFVV